MITQQAQTVGRALGTAAMLTLSLACSEPSRCEEVHSEMLDDAIETPERVSVDEVMAMVGPRHDVPFTWNDSVTNATGMTVLSIGVDRTTETARYLVTEQTGAQKDDLDCGPSLRMPAVLGVSTSDGALDESFEGELVYDLTRFGPPTFRSSLDFERLNGWLAIDEPGGIGEIWAVFGYNEYGAVGVTRTMRSSHGDAAEHFEQAGSWGTPPD